MQKIPAICRRIQQAGATASLRTSIRFGVGAVSGIRAGLDAK